MWMLVWHHLLKKSENFMDPEIFHQSFIQAIKSKDNTSFLALLPKIATRSPEFRCKYFYTAGCEGTAMMVEHLLNKVQPDYRIIMNTLYDAMNYNNTETVKVLAPHIVDNISAMASSHICTSPRINPDIIQILSTHMIVGDFENMVASCAKRNFNIEDKLATIWKFLNRDLFFKTYTLNYIAGLQQDNNRRFLEDQYEIFTAKTQKNTLQEHIGTIGKPSQRKI